MEVPAHLRGYLCDEYYASHWAEQGCWDEESQLMLIVPASDVEERPDLSFLVVGRPGSDGIEFGYRERQTGLWAYDPIDCEFVPVAATVEELIARFLSGDLTV